MLMGPENYEEKHEKWMKEIERKKRTADDERLREYLVSELEQVNARLPHRSEVDG
jgi:hypothetical protein